MKTDIIKLAPDQLKDFLVYDARLSFMKASKLIKKPTKIEFNLIDELNSKALKAEIPPLQYIVLEVFENGKLIDINTRIANFYLQIFLHSYRENVEAGQENIDYFFDYLYLVWNKKNDKYATYFNILSSAVETLAKFSTQEVNSEVSFLKLGKLCYLLGTELESYNKLEDAISNIHSGISFTNLHKPTESIEMFNRLIQITAKLNLSDISVYLLQNASLMCQIARNNKNKNIDAYDATERLIRYVIARYKIYDIKHENLNIDEIKTLLKENDYLNNLKPLFYYALDLVKSPESIDVEILCNTLWNKSTEEWFCSYKYIKHFIIETANVRFKLLERNVNTLTRWNDSTIQYKNLLEAVPIYKSILKEEFINNILMDLKHELIHVYSLFGSVGVTLNLMRWILIDLEVFILRNNVNIKDKKQVDFITSSLLKSKRPVQLIKPNLISLSFVERSVVLEKKIQIIENVWTPWFEGLAVFGEFTDNPILDKEIESPLSTVINHIIDIHVQQEADEKRLTVQELIKEHIKLTEELYNKALSKDGVYKLRSYLEAYHKKYLPGYLCVRSILGKWRNKYKGGPIQGDEAFRLLLHITRFSGLEVIPDLGLPLSEFKEAVIEKHFVWLNNISNISNEDLEIFLSQDSSLASKPTFWKEGKFMRSEISDKEVLDQYLLKAEQCLSYLTADNDDIGRVKQSNRDTSTMLNVIAEVVGRHRNSSDIFNNIIDYGILDRYTILPFAKTLCPFWLIENDNVLNCLIRTRESDIERSDPSYNLISIPISIEEFKKIKALFLKSGIPNITLTRAIILGGIEGMNLPRQFLIFQYEDWVFIQNAGMYWGSSEIPEELILTLKSRFLPNQLIDYKESLNTSEHPLTQRTKVWLETNKWDKVLIDDLNVNVEPWANHVLALCNEVLANSAEDIEDISIKILKFVFNNDSVAEHIYMNGLNSIFEEEPLLKTEFIKFVFNSAYLPVYKSQTIEEMVNTISDKYSLLIQENNNEFDLTTLK